MTLNKVLLETYQNRLKRSLQEVDVYDSDGNVILTKDLKVRDKKSGYQYTISKIIKKGDVTNIVLNPPDQPRIEPAASEREILDGSDINDNPAQQLAINLYQPDIDYRPEEPLVVSQKDFESNFTVE